MKNRKFIKGIFIAFATIIFIAVSVFCFKEGYWTFNIPHMSSVETVERYCTYFDKGNTVGVNSLHYNSGEYGFHMQYNDTKSFRGNYKYISGVNLGHKDELLASENIVKEAVKNSAEYTVVKAKIKTGAENKEIERYFTLVKKTQNSRWRVCFVG